MTIRRKRRTPTTANVPICQTCSLAVYPRGSIGEAMGSGCRCQEPKPTEPLFPIVRRENADQLSLFTAAAIRRATRPPPAAAADVDEDAAPKFPRLAE